MSVHIGEGSVVCSSAVLEGEVSTGFRTIVHPLARIIARGGPIVIGDNNIIEEKVEIINDSEEEQVMIIGNGNTFQAGCSVRSLKIGNRNTVESFSYVGRGTVLPYGNVISAGCRLDTTEILPELTVIYSLDGEHRRRVAASPPGDNAEEVGLLAKLLPNYHQTLNTTPLSAGAGTDRPDNEEQIKPSSSTVNLSAPAKSFVRFKSLLHSNTSLRRNK